MDAQDASNRGAVVITGASTGIGEAAALRLARLGYLVFAGVRREADGAALQAQVPERIRPLRLDVTSAEDIAAAVSTVRAAVPGGIAGLVNNAGIAVAGPLECVPPDEIRRQFEVNFIGPVAVTQAFLPLLRAGRGRLINVGSVGGRIALPFVGAYASSKFAIEAASDVFRIELSSWGIAVSIIEAGAIATPMWEKARQGAEAIVEGLSEEGRRLYGDLITKARERTAHMARTASPAEPVAAAIEHALCAARPKTRYRVGKHAKVQHFVGRYLPDRWRDFCVRFFLGI